MVGHITNLNARHRESVHVTPRRRVSRAIHGLPLLKGFWVKKLGGLETDGTPTGEEGGVAPCVCIPQARETEVCDARKTRLVYENILLNSAEKNQSIYQR